MNETPSAPLPDGPALVVAPVLVRGAPIRLYRVEHLVTGEGPFRLRRPPDEDGCRWPVLDGTPAMACLMPHEEVMLAAQIEVVLGDREGWWKKGWRCACVSLDALQRQFGDPATLEALTPYPVGIQVLEAPHDPTQLLLGASQAVMAPAWYTAATRVATWPLATLGHAGRQRGALEASSLVGEDAGRRRLGPRALVRDRPKDGAPSRG